MKKTLHTVWMGLAVGLCLLAGVAHAAPVSTNVTLYSTATTYGFDDIIEIQIEFDENIDVANPGDLYLELDEIYPSEASTQIATYFGHINNLLVLEYRVQAGEYASPLQNGRLRLGAGGAIYTEGGDPVLDAWNPISGAVPSGTDPASIIQDNVQIETFSIVRGTATLEAGESTADAGYTSWQVDRGGTKSTSLDVAVSLSDPTRATIDGGVSVLTIPAGARNATFDLTGLAQGSTEVIATPSGYPAGVSYSNTFDVLAPADQFLVVEPAVNTPPPPYEEGVSRTWQVRRVGTPSGTLTVDMTFTDNNSAGAAVSVPTTVTMFDGQDTRTFTMQMLDGTYRATLTATDPGGTYNPGTAEIDVDNVAPTITGASVSPNNVTIQQQVTANFTADDVAADRPKLTGSINWGDGSAVVTGVTPGSSVNHIYDTPGEYEVIFTVEDTDGGIVQETRPVTVAAGKALAVTIRQPGFDGLDNIGSGQVVFSPTPAVTNFNNGTTISVQYPETATSAQITLIPDQPDAEGYNSYVFSLIGDGLQESDLVQLPAGASHVDHTAQVNLDQDRSITVLFSREWLLGDARGDIDGDGLTDEWEIRYGLLPLSPAGANGGGGSLTPDDRFPNATNVFLAGNLLPSGAPYGGPFGYPITWTAEWDGYAPVGPIFNNLLQFRGQTIIWNDADAPGTDPTVMDTSNNGLNDGWLYYFYVNALADTNFVGRAYDPATITGSLDIARQDIINLFNPSGTTGLPGEDVDNDGLTTIEEYALGTNPIDWDTDGDGMADGWEVLHGLDPLDRQDADDNEIRDEAGNILYREWMAADAAGNIHNEVYVLAGFDPRTGYSQHVLGNNLDWGPGSPNTRPFTKLDQYLVMRYWMERDDDLDAIAPEDWEDYSTNPNTPDTNGDRVADGWSLYVDVSPFPLRQGTISPSNSVAANFSSRAVNIAYSQDSAAVNQLLPNNPFPLLSPLWLNKIWPTDPNNGDTDGDQVSDLGETAFIYETDQSLEERYLLPIPVAGGGLNPTSADTDGDGLPDAWEVAFAGGVSISPGTNVVVSNEFGIATNYIPSGVLIRTGMDGTYSDAFADYDGDGLLNYQEYLVGTLYHFQYDKWTRGLGYGGYDAGDFFDPAKYGLQSKPWDRGGNFLFQAAEPRLRGGFLPVLAFATTSPIDWDTDGDGMDDYYELFHGLNPLWGRSSLASKNYGDIVGRGAPTLVRDARVQPWQVGDQFADPDQDGLPNFEEMLAVNEDAPQNYHSDPSPYWFTDMSYSESFVNLYYQPGSIPYNYWSVFTPQYLFSFESNEGYDTDNDNLPDRRELSGTDGSGYTDPLNFLSPVRRKALYLDGDAAARTQTGFTHGSRALRSWTVEMWVRPENTATGQRQVLIERPIQYEKTDPLPFPDLIRRNFRLGFEADGRLFVEYDNAGNDLLTTRSRTEAAFIKNGEWYHVAGVFDGENKQLRLYVNGKLRGQVGASVIPANGIINTGNDEVFVRSAPIVLGASDANPNGDVNGGLLYYYGSVYPSPPQPSLSNFYQGWIDEVRIWSGALSTAEIQSEMNQSFTREDVMAASGYNTYSSQMETNVVATTNGFADAELPDLDPRVEALSSLDAVLLYHYNFDNLPDPDYEPITPDSYASLNGRPNDGTYSGVPWWSLANDRSQIYNDYSFVQIIENTVVHLPRANPLDSYYWNDQIDDFPNTMNPYAEGFSREARRIAPMNAFAYHPTGFRWGFSNLLPLRNARADMDVDLWDGKGDGMNDDAIDTNGDGIPDWWYYKYGLDPAGKSVAEDDFDEDGLSNYAEYLIGSDPNNAFSLDPVNGLSDFDAFAPNGLTYGEIYTHWDGIPAWWKKLYERFSSVTGNPGLSTDKHDAELDPDEDGWSNLAEFMSSYAAFGRSTPQNPSPLLYQEFPIPEVQIRVRYHGANGASISDIFEFNDFIVSDDVLNLTYLDADGIIRYYPRPYIDTSIANPVVRESLIISYAVGGTRYIARASFDGDITGEFIEGGFFNYKTGSLRVYFDTGLRNVVFESYTYQSYGQGQIHLAVYDNPNMDGEPVGSHLLLAPADVISDLDIGKWVEGTNYVFAFLDLDRDGIWDTDWVDNYSEPAAVSSVEVGWADGAELDLELTEEPKGYWRFSWPAVQDAIGYTVVVRQGDTELFRRNIHTAGVANSGIAGNRNYMHEGDFMAAGVNGLRSGLHSCLIYVARDFFGTEADMYHANVFRTVNDVVGSAAPVIKTPSGRVFKESLNIIEWTMDANATKYQIEIASNNNNAPGTTLASQTRMRPSKNASGAYFAPLPFYASDTGNVGQVWTNGLYWFRIRGVSDAGQTPYSSWKYFELDVIEPEDGGKSVIEGTLYYRGRVRSGYDQNPRYLAGETNLTMIVQAYENAAFVGRPTGQVQVEVPGAAVVNSRGVSVDYALMGLPAGMYYLRAFIDLDGDREMDTFEPRDMLRALGTGGGYLPGSVDLTGSLATRERNHDIVLRDHDMDNDGLADGWEYSYFGTLGYGALDDPGNTGATLLDQYVAPTVMMVPTMAYSVSTDLSDSEILYLMKYDSRRDSDGDGMTDLYETLYARTDPNDKADVLRIRVDQGTTEGLSIASSPVVRLTWEGRAGVRYVVRSSRDLIHWEDRAVLEGEGAHVFEESDATRGRQFYLIQVQ